MKKNNNNGLALWSLIKRNIKIYMKDWMTVFFSIMAPIIVLLLYILFLGKIQAESIANMEDIKQFIGNGEGQISMKEIYAIINNWMISGVMATSCITVAINVNIIMIRDKQSGAINDVLASPVKKWVIYLGYIIATFIISFVICMVVLIFSLIYLACSGGFFMSWGDFFEVLAVTLISVLSSSFFFVFVCGFFKSVSTLVAVNGVITTCIGFLIGAYLPFNMMPKAMQYIACFIPGAYSAGLFRDAFLRGCINMVQSKLPPDSNVINKLLTENFTIDFDFFGIKISAGYMFLVICCFVVLTALLLLIFYSSNKGSMFGKVKRKFSRAKVKNK